LKLQLQIYAMDIYAGSSNSATMSIDGVGIVSTVIGNHTSTVSAPATGVYGFTPSPYVVAAGARVTVEIVTYFDSDPTGGASFRSRIVFACDTGEIFALEGGAVDHGSDGCAITATQTRGSGWFQLLTGVALLVAARQRAQFLR
jgi:hypothetical protein